jgi:hypothetical protein
MKHLIKTFFVPLFFLSFTNAFSQSKGDTQIWIKSTIEHYRHKNYNYQVYFWNEALMIVQPIEGTVFYNDIPLKEINQVLVKEFTQPNGEVAYNLILACKYSAACSSSGTIEKGLKLPNYGSNEFELSILLDNSLKSDNMNNRLKKAMAHLVTLNGGKTINDVF